MHYLGSITFRPKGYKRWLVRSIEPLGYTLRMQHFVTMLYKHSDTSSFYWQWRYESLLKRDISVNEEILLSVYDYTTEYMRFRPKGCTYTLSAYATIADLESLWFKLTHALTLHNDRAVRIRLYRPKQGARMRFLLDIRG